MEGLNPCEEILERISKKTNKLLRIEEDIKLYFANGMINEGYALCLELENLAESLTLLTRQLPCFTGRPKAKFDVNNIIKSNVKVEIEYMPSGWFHLKMPTLLPKKDKGTTAYIRDFLYPALEEFFSQNEHAKFEKCHIIYRHLYEKNRPQRAYRDHDNFEINFVTDAIGLFTMIDDSPKHCSHHYYSAVGEKDETEVFVIPYESLQAWITKYDDENL